jgi:hypothetical protein
MLELFDNSFKNKSEDYMTAAFMLDSCPDKEKLNGFLKSVLPHSELEDGLTVLSKALKSESKPEKKDLAKSFMERFEAAGK